MELLDLVLKYEPTLLFSKDDQGREENFFPISAASYVAESALHQKGLGEIKARTTVTAADLAALSPPQSQQLYLTFAADEVLKHDPSFAERLRHGGLELFSVDGELTPQLVVQDSAGMAFAAGDPSLQPSSEGDELDPMISFSGPGSSGPGSEPAEVSFVLTDALQLPQQVHQAAMERYEPYRDLVVNPPTYYYSYLYNRGYLVIQYWFFYAYNDWGSGHGGVNDHEGDWEMTALFLRGEDPAYIAYSAHTGSPEWHAWDDTKVQKTGNTHPLVFVGSGSHANYFDNEGHVHFTFKDFSKGDSEVSIGPGAAFPWGQPLDLGQQKWALNFAGGWGALVKRFSTETLAMGTQAPVSPPWQFARWESPVAWAKIPLFGS